MDEFDAQINYLLLSSYIIGPLFFLFFMILIFYGIRASKEQTDEKKNSQAGERHGNGKHIWQVIVNNNMHVITLKAGWRKDTLMLDGDVIESGTVWRAKDYKFQIDGEPGLLTTRESLQHGWVHRLFVSGRQVL